jgi:hypothetical protein
MVCPVKTDLAVVLLGWLELVRVPQDWLGIRLTILLAMVSWCSVVELQCAGLCGKPQIVLALNDVLFTNCEI